MAVDLWLAFTAATMLVLIIPGPTILLVMSYALSRGPGVALAMVGGVALGDFIAMTVSLAGLGALLAASATLFFMMKWLGAIYLAVMGVRLIMAASKTAKTALPEMPVAATSASLRAAFRDAALVTVLNPKSIGFFIAFVPQFMDQARPVLPQFVIMIATFVILGAVNAGLYALMAGHIRSRFSGAGALRFLFRLGGATLLGLALMTALRRI